MIYPILLVVHNALRWLVLGSLLASLGSSISGLLRHRTYQPIDQTLRVVATSIAHTQLLVGFYLYAKSPIVSYYWKSHPTYQDGREFSFFSLIHIGLMLTSVIVMTIGSSKAKRQKSDQQKFKTTAIYFAIGLLLIFIAIPWPFSPFANRPLYRSF
ncbi:hypothetical protein IC229_21735 [Spirosoma sp. BT702]|uniref:Uncharacterized protein n=1 Tax=Spirosoma profusum TaxID=2771354 RepID=A0A926XYT6_9BACT|nr:hypothetical protein [Spirosoma profusum]MBD2703282.1 hypothetical protein [Spirosoma profusum]